MPNSGLATSSFQLSEEVIGCPIRASLGALGQKWGLLVLRDVAFCKDVRFSDLRRNIDGITPRMLTFRLRDLQAEGFIRRKTEGARATYELTEKGTDALPILAALTRFGVRHEAAQVFRDGKPRDLSEIVPAHPDEVLGATAVFAILGRHVRVTPRGRPARPRRGRGGSGSR